MTGTSPVVGVLGAGTMGAPMARNLALAGHEVRLWNRTAERAEEAAGDGVSAVESPAEAASGADALITILSDTDAVEAAMTGAGGALPELGEAPWVQMSTIGVAGTERMRATAGESEAVFVDAPVLGTKEPAERASCSCWPRVPTRPASAASLSSTPSVGRPCGSARPAPGRG